MRKRIWWFIIAVAVQGLILASVPVKKIYTLKTGQVIKLKTIPVDPYNILSGYFVTLRYEISQTPHDFDRNGNFYTVVSPDANGIYNLKSVSKTWPKDVDGGDVVIKGWSKNKWSSDIAYGIEAYFIPEDMRKKIEQDLGDNIKKVVIDVKVDKFGNAAILRINIGENIYEF